MGEHKRSLADQLVLFFACGFGTGRIPFAPGTFGTAVGFLWIWLLLIPGEIWIYILGIGAGFFLAVTIGSRAEKILGTKDPGAIVIDEMAAMPLAFLPAVLATMVKGAPREFFFFWQGKAILLPVLAFALFRLFDIWKPLGIKQSQNLRWGLVIDDFLAAVLAATALAVYLVPNR
jgi:phosphatidylglycerophosphatase A